MHKMKNKKHKRNKEITSKVMFQYLLLSFLSISWFGCMLRSLESNHVVIVKNYQSKYHFTFLSIWSY